MLSGDTPFSVLEDLFTPMLKKAYNDLEKEGLRKNDIDIRPSLDLRYEGQSYELNLPLEPNFPDTFEKHHKAQYGYSDPESSIELVNLRVRAIGNIVKPDILPYQLSSTDPTHALIDHNYVYFQNGKKYTPIYKGELLKSGNQITGPALIIRNDTTILLNPGDECTVDQFENLIIKLDSN